MSDKGEKTCPLCTEEMDLTDQQLKPCNCGYQICVWCWHHIMEMAEKDETEGRCPACRTPYDKEKIVAMAANCERLVAKINLERKQKLQKAKPKASEGRMHLTNVRVIKRNLVYIIGLPLNLADEDLLQRKEYFGRYGKVLKVSISRTATGAIQHAANNSCCVYITYSKEEEAVRCIQSVHSFVLEGRSLRACFGTTKYCHAWLRNMPCTIPDCLYLHDYGSLEDSFSKDEIVSAFSRSRVQQIIGATNNMHQRPGNALPPPADISSNISSVAKPVAKSYSNQNTGNQNSGSCVDGGIGRSSALPAAASWVMCVSGSLPPVSNSPTSIGLPNSKPETLNGPKVTASDVVGVKISNLDVRRPVTAEESHEGYHNFKLKPLELVKDYIDGDRQIAASNTNAKVLGKASVTLASSDPFLCLPASGAICRDIDVPPVNTSSLSHSGDVENFGDVGNWETCSGLSSISICSSLPIVPNSSVSNYVSVNLPGSRGLRQSISEQFSKTSTSPVLREAMTYKDLHGYDDDRHLLSMSSSSCFPQNLNQSSHSWKQGEFNDQTDLDVHPTITPIKNEEVPFPLTSKNPVSSNGFNDKNVNGFADLGSKYDYSTVLLEGGRGKYSGKFDNYMASIDMDVASDMGENSIISKILSIDLDPWEDSLTSPQGLVKLLSETDEQHGSLKISSLRKVPDSNQSRFSFARQEDFLNPASELEHSLHGVIHDADKSSAFRDLIGNRDFCMDNYLDVFSSSSSLESDNFLGSHPFTSSKYSVSKVPTSTPPGFSVPSRAPPPGFSTHGRVRKAFDSNVNHLLQTTASPTRQVGISEDVEFVDPAILEVGEGMVATGLNNPGFDMMPTFSPQLGPYENDAKLQLLMRLPISAHQNPIFPGHSSIMFSPPNDTYSISPMIMDKPQSYNPSAFVQHQFRKAHTSNDHWGSWNEAKNISDLGMSGLLTNGGLGFNKYIHSHEDLKYQMPGSGNLYNREFAM